MTRASSIPPASIRVRDLRKRFGTTEALRGITLDVEPGELFGVIGPDGAGKSTLFRILVTVLLPDSGSASVDDLDVRADFRAIRQRIGYMPGRFSLYSDLTVIENLTFFASVFGTTVDAEYDQIAPIYSQIEPFANRRAGDLSGGMKQKLALSCALIHRPRVLILDEPTTGVDAVSRTEFWDMLAVLKASGLTTLVSTPYMDEAARCDRIALMQSGQLLGRPNTPSAVAASLEAPLIRVQATGSRPTLLADLRSLDLVDQANVFGAWVHVTSHHQIDPPALAQRVGTSLRDRGWDAVVAEPAKPTVEDVFMAKLQHPSTESPAIA